MIPHRFPVHLSDRDEQRVMLVLDLLQYGCNPSDVAFQERDARLLREVGLGTLVRESYAGEYQSLPQDRYIEEVSALVGASFSDIKALVFRQPKRWVATTVTKGFPFAWYCYCGNPFFPVRTVILKSDRLSEPHDRVQIASTLNDGAAIALIDECSRRDAIGIDYETFGHLILHKLRILPSDAKASAWIQ